MHFDRDFLTLQDSNFDPVPSMQRLCSTVHVLNLAYPYHPIQTILLSDSSSEDENEDRPCSHEDLQAMLKVHKHQKKHQARYYQNPQLRKYMYYSTGLLSNYDKFPEHHKSIVGPKKKISKEQKKIEKKVKGLYC